MGRKACSRSATRTRTSLLPSRDAGSSSAATPVAKRVTTHAVPQGSALERHPLLRLRLPRRWTQTTGHPNSSRSGHIPTLPVMRIRGHQLQGLCLHDQRRPLRLSSGCGREVGLGVRRESAESPAGPKAPNYPNRETPSQMALANKANVPDSPLTRHSAESGPPVRGWIFGLFRERRPGRGRF